MKDMNHILHSFIVDYANDIIRMSAQCYFFQVTIGICGKSCERRRVNSVALTIKNLAHPLPTPSAMPSPMNEQKVALRDHAGGQSD